MSRAIYANIDVAPCGVPPVISVSQYDTDFTITFSLYSSDGNLTVESDTTASVSGTKPDKNGYNANASINVSAKTVKVTGAAQMTAVPGRAVFELTLFKSSKRLSTSNFILDIEPAALDADTVVSSSVINRFVTLENTISGYAETATTSASSASASAASAASAAQTERGKYIAFNSTGIMLAKMDGGTTYTPGTAPEGMLNILINANGIQCRDGQNYIGVITPDGDQKLAVDTNAASSTDDGELYSAITALDWASVISIGLLSVKNILAKILTLLKTHDTKLGYASDSLISYSGTYNQNNYITQSAFNSITLGQFKGSKIGILHFNLNIANNLPRSQYIHIGTLPIAPAVSINHMIAGSDSTHPPVFLNIPSSGDDAGKVRLYVYDTSSLAAQGWYRAEIPVILPYRTS